jgi:hypothetical protein
MAKRKKDGNKRKTKGKKRRWNKVRKKRKEKSI